MADYNRHAPFGGARGSIDTLTTDMPTTHLKGLFEFCFVEAIYSTRSPEHALSLSRSEILVVFDRAFDNVPQPTI